MANNIVQRGPGNIQPSTRLGQYHDALDDLGGGIQASFPVLSIKGKAWTIKFQGAKQIVMDDRGYPRPDIDVVIVMAPKHKSKVYFPDGFDEDNPAPPTCWSSDGKVPDIMVDIPQATSCAVCPMNVIGSRITDQKKKAKACGDHKRIVVVPAGDVANETFGGPILLRVPASSLKTLQAYGDHLKRNQALYFDCVTTMSFVPGIAHQVLNFDYARPLTDEEFEVIKAHRAGDQVRRILNEEIAVIDPSMAEVPTEGDDEDDTPESTNTDTKPRVQPVQTTSVKPPPPPAAQRPVQPVPLRPVPPPSPAAKAAQTPPQPQQAPVGSPPSVKVGAFSAKPAAPPLQPTKLNSTTQPSINQAVAQPAKAPPSTRTVVQASQPEPEPELPLEESNIQDELDKAFGKLMPNA